MQPPIPAHQRDTSGLTELDAYLLAGATPTGTPVNSSLSRLEVRLSARRSERAPGGTTLERALDVVAPLLTATAEWVADDGYVERQTFIPSAGARHPLTALILHRSGDAPHQAWAVSPSRMPLRFEVTRHKPHIEAILHAATTALRMEEHPSTLLVVLARFRRTLSKYTDGHTLVWRDAGIFVGAAHLVAESLNLRSCIAGIAETTALPLAGTSDALVDVGALALSERN